MVKKVGIFWRESHFFIISMRLKRFLKNHYPYSTSIAWFYPRSLRYHVLDVTIRVKYKKLNSCNVHAVNYICRPSLCWTPSLDLAQLYKHGNNCKNVSHFCMVAAWQQNKNLHTLQKIQRRRSCMYVVVLFVMICDI